MAERAGKPYRLQCVAVEKAVKTYDGVGPEQSQRGGGIIEIDMAILDTVLNTRWNIINIKLQAEIQRGCRTEALTDSAKVNSSIASCNLSVSPQNASSPKVS